MIKSFRHEQFRRLFESSLCEGSQGKPTSIQPDLSCEGGLRRFWSWRNSGDQNRGFDICSSSVFLVTREIDRVREIQSQLGPELSEAIRILSESGCKGFLDVARALFAEKCPLMRQAHPNKRNLHFLSCHSARLQIRLVAAQSLIRSMPRPYSRFSPTITIRLTVP